MKERPAFVACMSPCVIAVFAVFSCAPLSAQPKPAAPVLKGFPFTNESLSYTVNWPSGLNLGEGHMNAVRDGDKWRLELGIDAGVPGFAVRDTYRSMANGDLCSQSLNKDESHGTKKIQETIAIDRATHIASRTLTGGAISKTPVPDCIHDALSFLYYARRELGQGRVPATQQIDFGALYEARLEYTGAETVRVSDKDILADRIACHIKGPGSEIDFDAWFDRDPARTPLMVRVPLALGKFSLELVR